MQKCLLNGVEGIIQTFLRVTWTSLYADILLPIFSYCNLLPASAYTHIHDVQ